MDLQAHSIVRSCRRHVCQTYLAVGAVMREPLSIAAEFMIQQHDERPVPRLGGMYSCQRPGVDLCCVPLGRSA